MSYNTYQTEVEVELDGFELYEWVKENFEDRLVEDLRDKTEESVHERLSEDVEDLKGFLTKIAGKAEDEIVRRALQMALGVLEVAKQEQKFRSQQVELDQLRKDLEELKKGTQPVVIVGGA